MKTVPHGRKIVGSRWVHSYKSDELGNYVKTKSRRVAKEFTQMPNVDYHETTSPTPASAPVKTIVVAAHELSLPVFHLDVSQAFVQTSLEEENLYAPP
ncbi:unnamed protein product, partial [Ascophyllum nodosum]